MPPPSWARVVGLLVVSAAGTITAVLTGSAETAVGSIVPLLPYLPR
jgi:hypothetical protein